MNELDLIKLNIFESYDNGEITYGEKEYLLEQVEYAYEAGKINKELAQAIVNRDTAAINRYQTKDRLKAGAVGGALTVGALGLYKGARAMKKKYDESVNGLLKQKSKLETQLKNSKNVRERIILTKQIKAIEKQIKVLEKQSDKQLKKATTDTPALPDDIENTNESTFDLLLESIDDLYDED